MCWVQDEANLRICRFCRHDLVLAGTLTLIRGLLLSRVQPSLWRHALGYVFGSGLVFKCNSHPFGVWFQSSMVIGLNWSNEQDLTLQHSTQPNLVWEITCSFFISLISELLLFIDFSWRYDMRIAWADQPEPLDSWWWETVKNKTRRAPPEKPQRCST